MPAQTSANAAHSLNSPRLARDLALPVVFATAFPIAADWLVNR